MRESDCQDDIHPADGHVASWGSFDQAGGSWVPTPYGLSDVTAIASGPPHALALTSAGRVFGEGNNASGQCWVPPDLTNAEAIAAGNSFSRALRSDGTPVGWGSNEAGQLVPLPAGATH